MPCVRCGCESPRVKMLHGVLCVSRAACDKRRRERVGVTLALENPPIHTPETDERRVERATRAALYKFGLCVDCGLVPHSPGRPRCETCHALPAIVRILLQA